MDDAFEQWITDQQHSKQPIAGHARDMIIKWLDTNDEGVLFMCTFRYLVEYWKTGREPARFNIALADVGLTREEVAAQRAAGTSIQELARELLARKEDV
jgi:hypothetical protein